MKLESTLTSRGGVKEWREQHELGGAERDLPITAMGTIPHQLITRFLTNVPRPNGQRMPNVTWASALLSPSLLIQLPSDSHLLTKTAAETRTHHFLLQTSSAPIFAANYSFVQLCLTWSLFPTEADPYQCRFYLFVFSALSWNFLNSAIPYFSSIQSVNCRYTYWEIYFLCAVCYESYCQ